MLKNHATYQLEGHPDGEDSSNRFLLRWPFESHRRASPAHPAKRNRESREAFALS